MGAERTLRIRFLQHWLRLSDPELEEALYDWRAMRRFGRIDLVREPAPDETTMWKFRHLVDAPNQGDRTPTEAREHAAKDSTIELTYRELE